MQVRASTSRRLWLRAVTALATGCVLAASGLVTAGSASAAVNPAINITGLSMKFGSTAGGTTLLITGTGFLSDADIAETTNVLFGTDDAELVIVLSDTSMAVKAPAHAAGAVQVVISDGTGGGGDTSANTAADDFTYLAPLSAAVAAGTLLNPTGATSLTIGGASFATAADLTTAKVTATIGGVAAPVTWVSATTVRLTVPAGTPSATGVPIVLLTNGVAGPADSDAKYAAIVKTLSVTSGPVAGGGTVAVTGKGFTGGGTWLFGTEAATCTLGSGTPLLVDTTASCTVPAGAAAGAVSVTFDPAGTIPYGTTTGGTYTYTDVA